MNCITVAGNLGKDMEIRTVNGDAVGSFSVADSQGRDKPTIWWNCTLWGKRASALEQYLRKGQQVTVVGSVSEREWTDKEGHVRKSMEIRVTEVALQGGKPSGTNEPSHAPAPAPVRARAPAPAPAPAHGFSDDNDIPF